MLRLPTDATPSAANRELATILRSRVSNIGMLPSVATQALELMRNPNCSIREFAQVVQRDVSLAFEVLRMANSSLYGFDSPVSNFEEAVFRLGFRQCKNLILSSCFSSLMKGAKLEEEWIRDIIWQHSYVTAVIAVHLNRRLDLEFEGEEYTAGLLHDFGRLLLAVMLPEDFPTIDPLDFNESPDIILRETEALGTNHAELGAWYAADNSLPDMLVEAVRWHQDPKSARRHRRLTALTAAADHLANHLQCSNCPDGYDASQNLGAEVLSAETGRDYASSFAEVAQAVMERALQDTGGPNPKT